MANEPPEFCPRCGERLEPVDPPATFRCEACEAPVFHNPIPTARLAVLDGDALLLVKVDTPDRDMWGTPGGMIEPEEHPPQGGARELQEETTLVVDPADLVLFDARTFAKFGRIHKTYLAYAVSAADVTGRPQADDEVVDARFWTLDAFETAPVTLLSSWPRAYKDLRWWIDHARAALERGTTAPSPTGTSEGSERDRSGS